MEKNNAFIVQIYLKLGGISVKDVDIIKKIINMNVMNVNINGKIMITQ